MRAFPFFGEPTSKTLLTIVTDRLIRTRRLSRSRSRQRSSATSPNRNPHDLADPGDHVIAIDGGKWEITDTAPVVFKRTELTAPMPNPEIGGDLHRLWDFINVAEPDQPIVLAFMVAALIQPDVPHTILAFIAEHGSAKSTATKRVVSLTDPSVVPLRMPPRDIDTWITGANGSWVVALDNLSHISDWLSDALCRAARR